MIFKTTEGNIYYDDFNITNIIIYVFKKRYYLHHFLEIYLTIKEDNYYEKLYISTNHYSFDSLYFLNKRLSKKHIINIINKIIQDTNCLPKSVYFNTEYYKTSLNTTLVLKQEIKI